MNYLVARSLSESDRCNKKKISERKKKFEQVVKDLKKEGIVSAKESKMLDRLFVKKDEAVTRAFDQYIDAPNDQKFIERVESFLGERVKRSDDDEKKKKEAEKKKKEVRNPAILYFATLNVFSRLKAPAKSRGYICSHAHGANPCVPSRSCAT